MDDDSVQLVAQRHPVGLNVVGPSKQLNLPGAGGQPLNDPVDLVRLVAGGPHLGHNHVTVQAPVDWQVALGPHQAVLLAVVQPMPSPSGSNDPLQLVRLHPDDFVDALIAPELETVSAQLHSTARHPQEYQPFVLKFLTVKCNIVRKNWG